METIKTSLTLNKDIKEQAQKLFDEMGLTFSNAVELFLRAVIREQALPFAVTTKPMEIGYVYGVVKLPELSECKGVDEP